MTKARENVGPATFVTLSALTSAGVGVLGYFLLRGLIKPKVNAPTSLSDWQRRIVENGYRALTWADYDGWCTGYVGSIFRALGVNVHGNVSYMVNKAKQLGVFHRSDPKVGDIVFFNNTWDANRNGIPDDWYTHVGVVLEIEPDGTIKFGHGNFGNRRTTSYFNLLRPHDTTDEQGQVLNTTMRSRSSLELPGTPHTAAECVAGFATVRPEDAAVWGA